MKNFKLWPPLVFLCGSVQEVNKDAEACIWPIRRAMFVCPKHLKCSLSFWEKHIFKFWSERLKLLQFVLQVQFECNDW